MGDKFKVVTTDGTLVNKGADKTEGGLEEKVAEADAKKRNDKAEELGVETRYEVKPL